MIVDSLMHRRIVAADASMSVRDAARLMRERRVGCVVATQGDEAVGIVTERDIAYRVVAAERDPATTRLADVMSAPIATIAPEATIEDAAARMRELRIKRLVVLREGEAVGLVSVTDIAYASPETGRAMLETWVKQRWED